MGVEHYNIRLTAHHRPPAHLHLHLRPLTTTFQRNFARYGLYVPTGCWLFRKPCQLHI